MVVMNLTVPITIMCSYQASRDDLAVYVALKNAPPAECIQVVQAHRSTLGQQVRDGARSLSLQLEWDHQEEADQYDL